MTFTRNGKNKTFAVSLQLTACVYSKVKLFVFAMNSRRRYSFFVCFIYGLEENPKSDVIFAVCRLPLTSSLTLYMHYIVIQSGCEGISG